MLGILDMQTLELHLLAEICQILNDPELTINMKRAILREKYACSDALVEELIAKEHQV